MRRINLENKTEFKAFFINGGCAFIKDGITQNFMELYRFEDFDRDYYRLLTKEGTFCYFEPPTKLMMEMYVKYQEEGCSIKWLFD